MKACLTFSLLSIGVVACVAPPKNVGLESDSSEVTESDGETETIGESGTEGSGETGTPGACDGIADATACGATQDCAWVEITTIAGSGDFCGFEEPRFECIATAYQGEGCSTPSACGEGAPPAYWRAIDEETAEIIEPTAHDFCANQPVGFDYCIWNEVGTLTDGHDACACICPGGGGQLFPGIEESLTEHGGCSDVWLYGYNEPGTIALTFYVDAGYAAQAVDTDTPVDVELTPGGDVEVHIFQGVNLQNMFCTDVGGQGETHASWTATSGTLALHIEPVDGNPRATVTLTDVLFEGDEPAFDDYQVADYTITDVLVGWLPG